MSLSYRVLVSEAEWIETISGFPHADFHHTFAFHRVSQYNDEGTPMLLLAIEDGIVIMAWPLLGRDIPGTDFKDLGSVYGYPGPLFNTCHSPMKIVRAAFDWIESEGYVSIVGRLHPIANADLMGDENYSEVRKLGIAVAVDLSRETSDIKREIRGAKNGTIKKIEKAGVHIRQSRDSADTPVFQAIYRENMDRIGASPYYYFTDDYLNNILAANEFDACYQIAELENESIAATSIIDTNEIRQYYLSGTLNAHTRLSPMSLILRNQIFDAKEKGLKWFILGGGLGGQLDSLTHYKLGFSKTTFNTGMICKIFRPDIYDALAEDKDTEFFPAYRSS